MCQHCTRNWGDNEKNNHISSWGPYSPVIEGYKWILRQWVNSTLEACTGCTIVGWDHIKGGDAQVYVLIKDGKQFKVGGEA